jgi:hypothetical protein
LNNSTASANYATKLSWVRIHAGVLRIHCHALYLIQDLIGIMVTGFGASWAIVYFVLFFLIYKKEPKFLATF